MDGSVDRWMGGWVNEWVDGWMSGNGSTRCVLLSVTFPDNRMLVSRLPASVQQTAKAPASCLAALAVALRTAAVCFCYCCFIALPF